MIAMQKENKPSLGITMGCPVGIGPEIIVKFLAGTDGQTNPLVVIGSFELLQQTARDLNLPVAFFSWQPGVPWQKNKVAVYSTVDLDLSKLEPGRVSEETALAMTAWIKQGVELSLQGDIIGMVTCPISKTGLRLAGLPWPGHTEMLNALTSSDRYGMMMAGSRLKVCLLTIHEPLARVSSLLSRDLIHKSISLAVDTLNNDFAIDNPKVAVAGLNPHAGEDCMFGREEKEIIKPAIDSWQGAAEVSGPWPPDTVYYKAAGGEYDVVLAPYHDQGLIPFKLLHFKDGVNVTMGLPIVRTSVDHGTAYDIAGKNMADPSSLQAAVKLAFFLAVNRLKGRSTS